MTENVPNNQARGVARNPDIATRAELERLRASRPVPAPFRDLTPEGLNAVDVRRAINDAAELRIKNLQGRLDRVREGAERDHAFALVRGRAKADFSREK